MNNRNRSYFSVSDLGWPADSLPACCGCSSRVLNQRFAGPQSLVLLPIWQASYLSDKPTVSYYKAISHLACLTHAYTYCVGQCRGSQISEWITKLLQPVIRMSRVLRFPLPIFIPPIAPQSPSSIIWGLHNRPDVAAVPSGLSPTSLIIIIIIIIIIINMRMSVNI
jgi:hypothetical protein